MKKFASLSPLIKKDRPVKCIQKRAPVEFSSKHAHMRNPVTGSIFNERELGFKVCLHCFIIAIVMKLVVYCVPDFVQKKISSANS